MTASRLVDADTGEVVEAALVPLPADPSALDAYADPGRFVELACERAKEWLAQALDKGDIDGIVELKSQAEAIRSYTAQKQLGKDAELSAAEIVRRAERGIGLAIRKGQENGEIRRRGQSRVEHQPDGNRLVSPTDFAKGHDLTGGGAQPGYYDVSDGVSDDEFEEAITEAKEEGNLSRTNVVRKIRQDPAAKLKAKAGPMTSLQRVVRAREMAAEGCTSRQIGEAIGVRAMGDFKARHRIEVPADAVVGKTRRHDTNRIIRETVYALDGAASALDLIDLDAVDLDQVEGWVTSLSSSLRSLNRLHKQLKEMPNAKD